MAGVAGILAVSGRAPFPILTGLGQVSLGWICLPNAYLVTDMADLSNYVHLDAVEISALIRVGELHPREVVGAAVDRIEQLDDRVNAISWRCFEQALEQAERPLPDSAVAGVPFLVKGLSQTVAGAPHTLACRMRSGVTAPHDSTLVARYRAAGLLVLGQSTTPEFGTIAETHSSLYGTTRNPWNLERSPGGSSGGAAAAVAARFVPVAHASDGGGSIRIPSSACGVVGLKPTRGRTPCGPAVGEGWFGLVVEHAVTRTVRDSAALLDVSHGPDPGAPYFPPPPDRPYLQEVTRPPGRLRIAVSPESMMSDSMHRHCVEAVERTAALLEELGHQVTVASPTIDRDSFVRAVSMMIAADTASSIEVAALAAGRRVSADGYEALSWLIGQIGRRLTAQDLADSLRYVRNIGRVVAPFFDEFDVFVEPTIALPPWKSRDLFQPPKRWERMLVASLRGRWFALRLVREISGPSFRAVPNTMLWNATGQPSMSLPLHWADGLPIGVQFTARYADEALLFRLADQLEQARPWIPRLPPLLGG